MRWKPKIMKNNKIYPIRVEELKFIKNNPSILLQPNNQKNLKTNIILQIIL